MLSQPEANRRRRLACGLGAILTAMSAGFLCFALTHSPVRAESSDLEWALPENPLEGRDLFTSKKCVNCHAVWGEGDNYGPDLSQIGRNRTLLQLCGLLWNHSARMDENMAEMGIERPSFEPGEMRSLLSYLFFLNYFDEPGDFETGELIFREKKCIVCHAVGDVGENVALPLDHFKQDRTPLYFAQSMWNSGQAMTRLMSERRIPLPSFQGEEYSHLLAYIRGQANGDPGEPNYLHPGNPKRGKQIFEEKGCGACHAIHRTEESIVGPNLGDRYLWKSVSEYAAVMWNHSGAMWEQMGDPPRFDGNELADLISYLYYNFYIDEPGNVQLGRKLFESKNCAACHQVGGVGTIAGPDLTQSESAYSAVALATTMWNHAPFMVEELKVENFAWPKFSGNEMRDLIAFIQANANETPAKSGFDDEESEELEEQ